MRLKIRNELLALVLLVIMLLIAITFFPSNILRIILGLPFVLFFPGYTLMAALFPRKDGMGDIERLALSFGLSIAVVPIIGLILNYTALGIRLYPILISVTTFILIMSTISWWRRHKLAKEERFAISFNLSLPPWGGQNMVDKVLSIVLITTVLGVIGTTGYALVTPKVGENLTEFYLLGQESRQGSYPRELSVGEEARVVVGIVNNEYKTMNYRLEVRINGVKNNEVEGISLKHGERWESQVSFTPTVAGSKQKTEFLLYEKGEARPLLEPLWLWLDVAE